MDIDFAQAKRPLRERVFDLLRDGQWHTWRELHAVGGVRYSARLLELRRQGYAIETRESQTKEGQDYRLTSIQAAPAAAAPKRVRVFLEEVDVEAILKNPPQMTGRAEAALRQALRSFRLNKHKL